MTCCNAPSCKSTERPGTHVNQRQATLTYRTRLASTGRPNYCELRQSVRDKANVENIICSFSSVVKRPGRQLGFTRFRCTPCAVTGSAKHTEHHLQIQLRHEQKGEVVSWDLPDSNVHQWQAMLNTLNTTCSFNYAMNRKVRSSGGIYYTNVHQWQAMLNTRNTTCSFNYVINVKARSSCTSVNISDRQREKPEHVHV